MSISGDASTPEFLYGDNLYNIDRIDVGLAKTDNCRVATVNVDDFYLEVRTAE